MNPKLLLTNFVAFAEDIKIALMVKGALDSISDKDFLQVSDSDYLRTNRKLDQYAQLKILGAVSANLCRSKWLNPKICGPT